MNNLDTLQARAKALNLTPVGTFGRKPQPKAGCRPLIDWEERSGARRSLERRLREARIGRFKPICDFDWNWPKRATRRFRSLESLDFLKDATNICPGRSKRRRKINAGPQPAHQAADHGHTVLFTSAGQLCSAISPRSTAILRYVGAAHLRAPRPAGHRRGRLPSYSNRHADLLFELISRRYENKSTVVNHQPAIRRMARGVPQCHLRRLPRRSSRSPRRKSSLSKAIISSQGANERSEQRHTPTPQGQVMTNANKTNRKPSRSRSQPTGPQSRPSLSSNLSTNCETRSGAACPPAAREYRNDSRARAKHDPIDPDDLPF